MHLNQLNLQLPTLIIYGERDTSLGVFSASHLRALPNGRVFKVPHAGHAAYLNNPDMFHTLVLNFVDLVRTYNNNKTLVKQ
jgi:abhydrolase domain-containing protein 14